MKWYAKSSGTTNDKSKFIPVSREGLKHTHYRGGTDAVAIYLGNNRESRMFDGKGLILGGSHSPNYNVEGSLVGDLSAILIENINPLVNLVRVPKKQTALLGDFEVKRDRIARETLTKNVTNLSGVPSWMLSVLTRVMELSGKTHLEEVWPNIEVFFHGGVAFTPYRKQYEQLITSPRMHYMETYNASEGFFGLQSNPPTRHAAHARLRRVLRVHTHGRVREREPYGAPPRRRKHRRELRHGNINALRTVALYNR